MKTVLKGFVFLFLLLVPNFANAQRLPCPPIECGGAPEGDNPINQEPSAPLNPIIETPPPSISTEFTKGPKPPKPLTKDELKNQNQNNLNQAQNPPAPKPPPVVIMDEPITGTATLQTGGTSSDKPKPVVIAIDKDGKAVMTDASGAAQLSQEAQEQAQFQNETLAQFNIGQDLTGSNFSLLEQAAFLMTPAEGIAATEPQTIIFGIKIPGKPGKTQEQMVEELLKKAHDGNKEAIGQLMAGMMQVGIDLANKPKNQLTQTEKNFVTWLEQRIQNIRVEVARNTQNQWNQYVQENSVSTGMSQLLDNAVDPSGFDPQVQMDFENPNSDIVNALSATSGGIGGGVAVAAVGASATLFATGAPITALASVGVAPIVAGIGSAAGLAYQIYKTAAFAEYNKVVEEAVTAAQQPVDLQSLANSENGDQVIANALALVMLNNAGATSYTADGIAASLP